MRGKQPTTTTTTNFHKILFWVVFPLLEQFRQQRILQVLDETLFRLEQLFDWCLQATISTATFIALRGGGPAVVLLFTVMVVPMTVMVMATGPLGDRIVVVVVVMVMDVRPVRIWGGRAGDWKVGGKFLKSFHNNH